MPDISKITLPSGNTYDIKDAVARQMIAAGVSFVISWDGSTAPVVADIPAGAVVHWNSQAYYGTMSAEDARPGSFYLVHSSTTTGTSDIDTYDEYVPVGEAGSKSWEKIGDTQVDISNVVQRISVGGLEIAPDSYGVADIQAGVNEQVALYLQDKSGTFLGLQNTGDPENPISLKYYDPRTGFGQNVTNVSLLLLLTSLYSHPLYIIEPISLTEFRFYNIISVIFGAGFTIQAVGLQNISGSTRRTVYLTPDDVDGSLTGDLTTATIVTGVTFDKRTDEVLGSATTFTLSNGAVTHGSLTGHTDTVLGTGTTFNVTNPTINITPTTKYLSGSASGGGASWNSKDQKTVVTGYSSPTSDTFVKSVTAETGKNLVTTSVPNVTGNTNVSIPNVTGNADVSIPNVTSVGSASNWSFTMGSGDNSETLIIGGGNGTAPTLGANLSASKVTLGTNLSASKVTLGDAITVATGATSATGTGDAVVTGVTVGESGTALTGLGTASTANVIGASSTFTNTQPTISLQASDTSGSGRISYMQDVSATATGAAVTATGDNVTAIVSMPTSTVGTGITVGTNDKVNALTNDTDITVSSSNL